MANDEENKSFWDDFDTSNIDSYVQDQFNRNLKNFDNMLVDRYKKMNPNRDRPDTKLKSILDYNPVDGLMKLLDEKLEKFKTTPKGIEPIGPLHYHYGVRTPITLDSVYKILNTNKLVISYDTFCKIQGTTKENALAAGNYRDPSNKYDASAQALNAKTFPLKEVGIAFEHRRDKVSGKIVDEDDPTKFTNLDPNWSWDPPIVEKSSPDFLQHVGMPTDLDELGRQFLETIQIEEYIPEDKITDAKKRAKEKISADIDAGLYTTWTADGTLSDTILNADGSDTGVTTLLWGSSLEDGTIDPFDILGEPHPFEHRIIDIPGAEKPKIFDPNTGTEIEFNPEGFSKAQYLNDLEDYYWKDMLDQEEIDAQTTEDWFASGMAGPPPPGATPGYEVAWTSEATVRMYNFDEGKWEDNSQSGVGPPPPGLDDLDYFMQSTENPPEHPQEIIGPDAKLENVVDRWNQDLDTSKLAPDVNLYIGFQRANSKLADKLKEKHAMVALPISNIQVRWPKKNEGEVTIYFKQGFENPTDWAVKLLNDKQYHGFKPSPQGNRQHANQSGWYADDVICIAQYYNPDDPSSYDSVKMITDEINREFNQSMRQQSQNLASTAQQAANILLDSFSDKATMCCLFVSFLNANPDLKKKLTWDTYSVTGMFCVDTTDGEPIFALNEKRCAQAVDLLDKPYEWKEMTYSIEELLKHKRDELIAIKTILEIAMEGFVSFAVELKALLLNIMEILMTIIHMSLATWLNMVTKQLIDYLRQKIQEYKEEIITKAQNGSGNDKFVAALWRCLPLERILMMLIEALIGPPGLIGAVKDYSARLLAKFQRYAQTSNAELMALRSKLDRGPMYPYLKGAVEIIDWLLDLTAKGLMICGEYNFDDQVVYTGTEPEPSPELIWCQLPSGGVALMSQEDCDLLNGEVVEEGEFTEDQITSLTGCTDPNAVNYNPDAEIDDGTCLYDSNTGNPEEDEYACQLPDGTIQMMTEAECDAAGGTITDMTGNFNGSDFTDPLDPAYYDTSPYTGQIDITDTEIDPLKLLIDADEAEMAKFFNKYIGISRQDAANAAADAAAGRCVDLLSKEQVQNMKTVLNTAGVPEDGK